jgi:hypothetical protein
MTGVTRSEQPKWFSGLSERFRDCASSRETAQRQKKSADAANNETKSAGTASGLSGMGQTVNALTKPKTLWFGRQTRGMSDNIGILNEIGQSIAYMKQVDLEEKARAAKESAKPPKPEESYGHWQGGSAVTVKGDLMSAFAERHTQNDALRYPDIASLRPAEPIDEDWATSGGLLHLDDNWMDFVDAAGNVYSLDRSVLWTSDAMTFLPPNITIRFPLGQDGKPLGTILPLIFGTYEMSTGFSVSFHAGGLERPANEYAKQYAETLEKYNNGEIDANEFDRRVGLMDKYFDDATQWEQSELRSIVSLFSTAMRVNDSEFFNRRTDPDVNAFLADVGRMYDNIRNHIKSGGSIDGLTKEIIEAGCVVSGLDDVKFLHSDKFWMDYMAPAMKALESEKGLGIFQTTIGAKWVKEHAKTWADLNAGVDADALSRHLKGLLLKLVNYGNDYRLGSFLQQLPYDKIGR